MNKLLLILLLAFSCNAQQSINFSGVYSNKTIYSNVNYTHGLNKNIYCGGGFGVRIMDSVSTGFDERGEKYKITQRKLNGFIPIIIGAKSTTKPLFFFGQINTYLLFKSKPLILPSFGLGYTYNHFNTSLGICYINSKLGGTLEAGFNF
jgi:hypothetical protein